MISQRADAVKIMTIQKDYKEFIKASASQSTKKVAKFEIAV